MEKQIQSNQRDKREHNPNLPSTHMLLLLHVLRHQQDHPRLYQLMQQQDHLLLVVAVDVLQEKDKHVERSFLGVMEST